MLSLGFVAFAFLVGFVSGCVASRIFVSRKRRLVVNLTAREYERWVEEFGGSTISSIGMGRYSIVIPKGMTSIDVFEDIEKMARGADIDVSTY